MAKTISDTHLWLKLKLKKEGEMRLHFYDNKNVRTQLNQWWKSVAPQITEWFLNGALEFRGIPGTQEKKCVPGCEVVCQSFILEQIPFRLIPNKFNSPRHSLLGSFQRTKIFLNGTLNILKKKSSWKQNHSSHCQKACIAVLNFIFTLVTAIYLKAMCIF